MILQSFKCKKVYSSFLIIFFSILLQGCSLGTNKKNPIYTGQLNASSKKVGIKELIKNPDIYKNEVIEVTGTYIRGVEECALYINTSGINRDTKKALWISFDDEYYPLVDSISKINLLSSYKTIEQIQGKKVRIKGTFNPDSKGHLEMFFGTIENVFYVEILK